MAVRSPILNLGYWLEYTINRRLLPSLERVTISQFWQSTRCPNGNQKCTQWIHGRCRNVCVIWNASQDQRELFSERIAQSKHLPQVWVKLGVRCTPPIKRLTITLLFVVDGTLQIWKPFMSSCAVMRKIAKGGTTVRHVSPSMQVLLDWGVRLGWHTRKVASRSVSFNPCSHGYLTQSIGRFRPLTSMDFVILVTILNNVVSRQQIVQPWASIWTITLRERIIVLDISVYLQYWIATSNSTRRIRRNRWRRINQWWGRLSCLKC